MPDPVDPPKDQDKKPDAPPAPPTPPSDVKPPPTPPEITKIAEELGMARKENETLKEYQNRVNPVIETIWSDPELFKQVEEKHKKRLSGDTKPSDTPPPDTKPPTDTDVDTRNAVIRDIVDTFSDKYGITKLESKEKGEMNTKVGTMLKDLLDPKGNKRDLSAVMEDVSLTKLPFYLEQAYYLANKDSMMAAAKEQGKKELQDASLGIIGSFSSTSIEPDTVVLSAKEKQIAENMGVSQEKYLARKKEILKRNNELV